MRISDWSSDVCSSDLDSGGGMAYDLRRTTRTGRFLGGGAGKPAQQRRTGMSFTRRTFVGGALAAPFVLSLLRGARADGPVLRVIPRADLKKLDPIWPPPHIPRNPGYLVIATHTQAVR